MEITKCHTTIFRVLKTAETLNVAYPIKSRIFSSQTIEIITFYAVSFHVLFRTAGATSVVYRQRKVFIDSARCLFAVTNKRKLQNVMELMFV